MDEEDLEIAEILAGTKDITDPEDAIPATECLIRGSSVRFLGPVGDEQFWEPLWGASEPYVNCKTLEDAIRVFLQEIS